MTIRTNTNPRQMDLQPEMRNLLMRNGLQAHVAFDGGGYRLIVQGHDSPLLVYPITERQMLALTDWGTNTANKKAYNILTSIIGKDFYMPKNFVHARNANGRVAMGLHGYRIGIGEYGHMGRLGMPPPFLGWTPREQWGFHLRRVGGQLFFPGPSIVPERPDGRMKPGELQSGGYGFYYKGGQQEQPIVQQDVLKNLQEVITPLVSRPRSKEPAQAYKELIASPVYFSNEKWSECLTSHGLIVDMERRTLTVQSESVNADMVYDLTEEEVKKLATASIEEQPVEKRLDLLNGIIGADFAAQTEGKYKMSAVIDGQVISHEISQKDYDKFLAVDDYHRMKLFSKIFNEVDMKTRPEANKGLGVKIFAALTAGAVVASEVAHGFHHHHSPEFYGERFSGPPHPYFKPGVDTPRDVAIRNFEAQMNQDINEMRRGR